MTTKWLAGFAAASMLAAPVLANGSASTLSVIGSDARAGAAMSNASDQDDGGNGIFIAIGAAAAIALAIVLISGGDDEDDLPSSP